MSDPDVSGHGSISSSMDGGSSVTFDSRSRSTSAATSSVHGTYCQDPVASLMMEDG